ncbi:MAG TPA: glycosyltransferase family 4 protein [Verrucomicrobiae bacterium]|nr:glycosyltransferase family 4 protein [Verrucomicrobiae bacterium]
MTNRKRIALVTLDYPPERGGVARYLGNLVEESRGEIAVFVNRTHRAMGPGHVEAVTLIEEGWPAWWPMVGFMKGLRDKHMDSVLVSHALPCGTAAWIARLQGGLPYGVLMHGLDLRLARRNAWKRFLLRRILRNAKLVIANSQVVATEIRDFDPRITPLLLTPGVEERSFPAREIARRAFDIPADTFQLLAVTRLVPRKGIDRLIQSMALLPPDVRLTVIGDGTDRERLLTLAQSLGERVRFLHEVDDTERDAWYAASDVFALPVRDEGDDVEGFGIVFLEAAQAGLPCIAGKSGGAVEAVIDEQTGLLVPPNDPQAIAGAIARLRGDLLFRQRLGMAGKARVAADFRWSDRWGKLKERL